MDVKVAIDCMGGDPGAHVTVPAALNVLRDDPGASFLLVGRQDAIERELARHGTAPAGRVSVRHASQVIEMDEHPAAAVKAKGDSSMVVGMDLVKRGEADGFFTAGNSGGALAAALLRREGGERPLGRIPGIQRPCLSTIPVVLAR